MADAKRDNNRVPTLIAVSNADGATPVVLWADPVTHRLLVDFAGGSGTVTEVSVVTANGVSGTVANPTTTPAITLALGDITPSSVAATGTVTGSNLSGTNTGDQTLAGLGGVPTTRQVNGHALSGDVTVTKTDISLGNVDNVQQLPMSYLDTDVALTANSDSKVASQKATKSYVDNMALGLVPKPAAHAATTEALPAYTYSNGTLGVGATITLSSVGVLTIDGRGIVLNDYVLVKNETAGNAPYNGLYKCTTEGTVAVAAILTRDTSMDSANKFSNALIVCENGTANQGTIWLCTNNGPVVVGTTAITFTQIPTAGAPVAGTGISVSGNTVSIDTTVTVDKTTAQALTNKDLTGAGNTFPTFNQNTTGSAAKLTTARSINGVNFDGTANIVTNKPRVGTTTSSATPTINTDTTDMYVLTAQAVDITSFTTNLSGTPVEGQKLWIAITGTGTRAITWGTSFEASTVALPTSVVTSRLDIGFVYNSATSKWRCVGVV